MAFLQGPPINAERLLQLDWWRDVDIGERDACWPWVKSTASHGYGQTWDGITVRLAHRVAWTLVHGPIPQGMTIDHTCHNRRCCNPTHLRLLSNVANASDNGFATKTHCPHGHPYDGVNTRIRRKPDGRTFRVCRTCWP